MNTNIFSTMEKKTDLWKTPEEAVNVIVPYIKKYFKDKIVWCPFDDENSNFVKIFKKENIKVVFSHIDNNQDFFKYEPENWDIMVSNPPFSLKDKILKRAYDLNKPFALILPIFSLSGKYRWNLFRDKKLQVLITKNRICFIPPDIVENKYNRPPFESGYFAYKFFEEQINFENE